MYTRAGPEHRPGKHESGLLLSTSLPIPGGEHPVLIPTPSSNVDVVKTYIF